VWLNRTGVSFLVYLTPSIPSLKEDVSPFSFFVAAHMGENGALNSNDIRNLKIAAAKSKSNYETPSKRRGG